MQDVSTWLRGLGKDALADIWDTLLRFAEEPGNDDEGEALEPITGAWYVQTNHVDGAKELVALQPVDRLGIVEARFACEQHPVIRMFALSDFGRHAYRSQIFCSNAAFSYAALVPNAKPRKVPLCNPQFAGRIGFLPSMESMALFDDGKRLWVPPVALQGLLPAVLTEGCRFWGICDGDSAVSFVGRYRQWLGKAFWVDGIKRSGRYSRGLSSKWCLASASLATVEDRRSVETLSTLADFSSSPAAQACRQLDRLHIMVGVPDEPVVSCGTTSYAATLPSARALELMRIGYQCLPALATLTGLSTRAFAASPVRSSPLQASTYVAPPRQLSFCKGLPCFQQTSARTASALAAVGESQAAGFGIAALSSFFNGSFPACQRLPKGEPLDPVLFNGLVCVGVFLSSLVVPFVFNVPFVFTAGGALGGVLFVFAALFSFVAIPRAGLATAQAVWSCSAIIVSFGWGAIGPAEVAAPVADITGSIAALALLIAGALVIVNCDGIAKGLSGESAREASASGEASSGSGESGGERTAGIASALAVGIFGGSVLVPFKFIPPEAAGLTAIPSFGLGALLAGVVVTLGYWKAVKKEKDWPVVASDQILAGLASGLLWNAGNVCSVIAQSPPFSLPYGVAYPILQCALFFGGLWGIYAFKAMALRLNA
ncbi:TMEM144 [Symbiodinium natans]|uniref:TMEM144 protein n=1 Tax=Symbiodinium natans TaxID=878477 RepID=A0A812LWE3_9DINO|nr:TMEM144 [Symbiodinium natans]